MIQSFNLDSAVLQELMIILCSNVKYEFFNKGQIIYKIGEPAEKFFIVLNGEIKVFKPKKKLVKMTKKEYVLMLKKILDSKDPYLLKKTILSNKETMDINEYEIPRLIDKISRIHIIRLDLERKKYFMIRLEGKYTKTFENFIEEIDAGIIASNCTPEDIKIKLYYDQSIMTESDKEEDALIFDEDKYDVSIFDYEENGVLTNGNYFGENGNNAIDRKRTQYIVANKDTECMSISNDIYQKNILAEFQKLKNKEISFLNDNCMFRNIQKGTFLNHYFKYFSTEEYFRGENIFLEMQKTEKIYFIKEGRIEINLYTNVLKMHNYAKELMNINSEIINHFKEEEKLPILNFQPKNYMENLKKKKYVSLFLFKDNDMLGIEEAFYNFKRLYRATVISDKAFLYSIPINKFRKMVDFEPKMHDDFKKYSFMKICNLIQRLSNIKNDTLKFIDGNYKEDNIKKNSINEKANKEKCEKKASSEITVTNQVNTTRPTYTDSNVNLTDKNKNANKKNYKNKTNKKLKKSKESIVDELARYYQDYQNWNKQLNKKWDLLLNPQKDEYQFYKQINYELSTIKDLKSDIDKLRKNSVSNILPKIQSNRYSNFSTPRKPIETTSDNENSDSKRKFNYKNKTRSNNNSKSNSKSKQSNSPQNRNEEQKMNFEEKIKCESSDESMPKNQKKSNNKLSNWHSINGTKFFKGKISSKNLNKTMDESLINSNNINNNNISNPNISLKINTNAYTTRFSTSIFNKNKRINISNSNLFITNAPKIIEPLPILNEKNSALEHQLNMGIETINYNHGNISSRSFRDVDIRGTDKQEKSLLKSSKEKTNLNTRNNTKVNSIDEESLKASFNTNVNNNNKNSKSNLNNISNINSPKKVENLDTKKDLINYNIFNLRREEETEESGEKKENKDPFGSTKLILSQSVSLKTNKLKRLHKEYMPRYYSNKFTNNSYFEHLDEINENIKNENKKEEEIFSPKKELKRLVTNDPIDNLVVRKSSNFVPFSVDNSIDGIKKLNKRIQMLAPKKKYNFIVNNY